MKKASRNNRKAPISVSSPQLGVEITAAALRRIRIHARSSLGVEVCGVLVGSDGAAGTKVVASIEGQNSQQGGAHVTFTQETWQHIYETKDRDYPNQRIVGWYHSHPGFGIFLSEQDRFIQSNFFSSPGQIAWVYDPRSDEEGCFAWRDGKIARLEEWRIRDDSPLDRQKTLPAAKQPPDELEAIESNGSAARPRDRRVRWALLVVTHFAAFLAGIVLIFALTVYVLAPAVRAPQPPAASQRHSQPHLPEPASQGQRK